MLDDILFSPDDHIAIEYAPRVLAAIGDNPTGRYLAWYYIREYWGDFFLKYNFNFSGHSKITLKSSKLFFKKGFGYEKADWGHVNHHQHFW